jgi:hypothetical protein
MDYQESKFGGKELILRFDPKFKNEIMTNKMTNNHPDDFLMVYVGRLGAEKRLKDIKPMLEKLGSGVRIITK